MSLVVILAGGYQINYDKMNAFISSKSKEEEIKRESNR